MSAVAGPVPRLVAALLLALTAGGCALTGDEGPDEVPSTAGAVALPPTARQDVGPDGARCRGVVVGPDIALHRAMAARPPGTTYCLGPGVHRIVRPLRPQEGDTVAGLPGAVLSGAVVLGGWEPGPGGWTAPGRLPAGPSDHGPCLSSAPACAASEDVFVDGRPLVRVTSPDDVVPGSFFADYAQNTITVGSDPAGSLVEQAVAPSLVRSGRDEVTVRDLVLTMAANEAQVAAVESRQVFPRAGVGWRVIRNDVRLNHGVGVGIAGQGRVRGNLISEQGQLGLAVWGRGVQVRRNEIAYNGRSGYDPDWEAGGVKSWMTTSELVEDNHVHHNKGPGLWSDGGCDATLYRRNVVTDNWGAGIQHEISYDARIVGNRVERNGLRRKGWAWGAGIQIQSSGGRGRIEVRHNVVSDNTHSVVVLDSTDRRREDPHPRGPHVVRNVLIKANEVTLHPDQWTGLFHDYGTHAVFSRGIRWVDNTYHVDSEDQRSFGWEDELLTWRQWRSAEGAGQDRRGSLVVGAP